MPTLIYTPGVRVYIKTEHHGTLDVSDDLTQGTLVRRTDGVSTFDFTIQNARRKYDLVFTPNDTIVVMMKRLTWLRVFTGYLNSVPLRTAWPREVSLSASCSLKRLQYYYWDPYADNTLNLLVAASSAASPGAQKHGVVNNMILTVLREVVGWPSKKVHIGRIPDNWYDHTKQFADTVAGWSDDAIAAAQAYAQELGPAAVLAGSPFAIYRKLGLGGDYTGSDATSGSLIPGVGGGSYASPGYNAANPGALDDYPAPGTSVGTLGEGVYGGVSLTSNQVAIVNKIYDIGASRGTKGERNRIIYAAIMAAMQESTLNPNADNAKSPSHKGLFQMDDAKGSPAQRHNPEYAINWFYDTAHSISSVQTLDPAIIAERVERSGFGSRYIQWRPMAADLMRTIISKKIKGPSGDTATQDSQRVRSGRDFLATAQSLLPHHIPYVYGAYPGFLTASVPKSLDCSALVQWSVRKTLGGNLGNCPRTASEQAKWCARVKTQQALNTPGALVFVSTNGEASGVNHVEVSLGDGRRTVGARNKQSDIGISDNSPSYWSFGGLPPAFSYAQGPTGDGRFEVHNSSQSGGGTFWPVVANRVTTAYKKRGESWKLKYHTGVDFGDAEYGDDVFSVAAGTVVSVNTEESYGLVVRIKSGNVQHLYAHLSQADVPANQDVAAGQKIGEVGNSGNVYPRPSGPGDHSGAHLHFEARKSPYTYGDGNFIDPVAFIKEGSWQGSPTLPGTSDGQGEGFGVLASEGEGGMVSFEDTPTFDPNNPIDQLFADTKWKAIAVAVDAQESVVANSLQGALALLNDQPLLSPFITNLFASNMRSFCSAPNGDLIAWFPDYYGIWGSAAILKVEAIEVQDFEVVWSDDNFVTHQFVQRPADVSLDIHTGLVENSFNDVFDANLTKGIANIDAPEIMFSLFGFPPENAANFARFVYRKFGARPNIQQASGVLSPTGEFFMAVYFFMVQWAYQYQAAIPTTFMPEAWPGMLIQIEDFDFQAYITTVTHNFTFGEEGRFDTTINIAAPAYMPSEGKGKSEHALIGLPLAGGYIKNPSGLSQTPHKPHRPKRPDPVSIPYAPGWKDPGPLIPGVGG